jgi:hypothetical protein
MFIDIKHTNMPINDELILAVYCSIKNEASTKDKVVTYTEFYSISFKY